MTILPEWIAVDDYLNNLLVPTDDVLEHILAESQAADIPAMNVSPNQGKFLQLMVQICGARTVLEIGTLTGYSAIWMARALPPDGRLITLEFEAAYAALARQHFERAGLTDKILVREGNAVETLPQLAEEQTGPFDMIFVDADKPNNPTYFEWSLKLSRPGTLIILDNVVRRGEVINPRSDDPRVQGTQRVLAMIAAEPRVSATALQLVGSKGYDGFALIRVQ